MLNPKDLLLYLCTDRLLAMGRPITQSVEQAIQGGVTMVQLREKDASTRDFYQIALEVQAVTRRHGIPLAVNDRLDIALAIGADGVHLGQSDMPLEVARRLVGSRMFIGISAATAESALAAQKAGADYIGAGPVYPTGSKDDAGDAIGIAQLAAVCGAVSIPVVAIGGISAGNTPGIMESGADGIAVISAILSQPDITLAARALRALL